MMNIQKWQNTHAHNNCYPKLDVIGSTIHVPSLILISQSAQNHHVYALYMPTFPKYKAFISKMCNDEIQQQCLQ